MSHFRVRRDGLEFPVAGTEALLRLVHDGALSRKDRVRDPEEGTWCEASELEILKEAFATRAAAAEARRAQRNRPRPASLTAPGPTPLPPVAPPATSEPWPAAPEPPASFAIPDDLLSPDLEEAPTPKPIPKPVGPQPPAEANPPPPSPSGVLSFPNGAPLPNTAGHMEADQARAALEDPDAFLRQGRAPMPERPRPAARPWLLLGIAFVVVVVAFLVVTWVSDTANMRYAHPTGPASGDAEPAPPSAAPAAHAPRGPRDVGASELYDEMELALRDRLLQGCMTISKEDDLDTALRLELSRLGVQVQSIHAPIVSWGGRRGDVPLAVEIKVWYEGQDDRLDRELGAIGMVVGKYAQNYSLDVQTFEVFVRDAEGETRGRSLDAAAARQLYLRRRSLLAFLSGEDG